MSTFGAILSFVLSTAVLFVGPRIAADLPEWFGLLVVLAYLVAIPIGGLAGAIAGFLITRRLLIRIPN
jgi:ribose/xylose/arabinose/galactoside ABC-type transport system permease subunit